MFVQNSGLICSGATVSDDFCLISTNKLTELYCYSVC